MIIFPLVRVKMPPAWLCVVDMLSEYSIVNARGAVRRNGGRRVERNGRAEEARLRRRFAGKPFELCKVSGVVGGAHCRQGDCRAGEREPAGTRDDREIARSRDVQVLASGPDQSVCEAGFPGGQRCRMLERTKENTKKERKPCSLRPTPTNDMARSPFAAQLPAKTKKEKAGIKKKSN